MYMSYCRYEGTLSELRACLADADEHYCEEAEYEVSECEIEYFRKMVECFCDWCAEKSLIDEYGDVDREKLDEICDSMRKSYCGEDD